MTNIKRKINQICKKNINSEIVRVVILGLLAFVFGGQSLFSKDVILDDFLDISIIISFLLVVVSDVIAKLFIYIIGKNTEDDAKLSTDYNELVKKYRFDIPKMIKFRDTIFPVNELCSRRIDSHPFQFKIDCSQNDKYRPPEQISELSSEIFQAHKYSVVYNAICIRLNDIKYTKKNHMIKLDYSFTTYYDSLITNRAMDYPFEPNKTIRELYEPGPFISELVESKLSNHLGFNGFVELSDNKIIFVYRGKDVSIGKGTWATSIGASLKTIYALDTNKNFTTKGLSNAIRAEIMDELKIELPDNKDYSKTIFAFYRDLVEGGKPQFLFYCKTDSYSSKSFSNHFQQIINKPDVKKANKKNQTVDGTNFKFLTFVELKESILTIDGIILKNGEKLSMMPSSVASLAILLNNI